MGKYHAIVIDHMDHSISHCIIEADSFEEAWDIYNSDHALSYNTCIILKGKKKTLKFLKNISKLKHKLNENN